VLIILAEEEMASKLSEMRHVNDALRLSIAKLTAMMQGIQAE